MATIEGEHAGQHIRITTGPATVLAGMRRTRIRLEGEAAGEADPDRRLLRLLTYPDVMAGAAKIEVGQPGGVLSSAGPGWPDFETFLGLPDGLVAAWEQAVYTDNPHWLPGGGVTEDPKAPVTGSTSG